MLDNQSKIMNVLLQLQELLNEDFEDNEDIQNAFNQLASALDYYCE
jgi:hypothetical protein